MASTERQFLDLILAGMEFLGGTADLSEQDPGEQDPGEQDPGEPGAGEPRTPGVGRFEIGGFDLGLDPCDQASPPALDRDLIGPAAGEAQAGRPFTVPAGKRTAAPQARRDWTGRPAASQRPDGLADRATLAGHYLRLAGAEHASVASFHRVALELLHLGASADLIEETQRAAGDELRHARTAYSLAAWFGAGPVGPGPLDVSDALSIDLTPAGVLGRVADEACAQETLSALALGEASRRAQDPCLAETLWTMAREEEEHAALGWATLRWLVGRHPDLRPLARERVMAALDGPLRGADDDRLETWGALSTATWARLRDRALVAVVLPAINAVA